jgi:rSAM/selenodomain-associated transferase 2
MKSMDARMELPGIEWPAETLVGGGRRSGYHRPMSVSVIIPALNEAERIGAAVRSAFAAGAGEVVVSDGGSSDATHELAKEAGATLVCGAPGRARQMNRAAEQATGAVLLFLHADTTLPPTAAHDALQAISRGALLGGFRLAFREPSTRLRIAAAMINLRTSLTRCPWGDQAQFLARDVFLREGGFREMPILEDYELAIRMKRQGRTVVLPSRVLTSGRRFLAKGIVRTSLINWRIILGWRSGASPEELAKLYRG